MIFRSSRYSLFLFKLSFQIKQLVWPIVSRNELKNTSNIPYFFAIRCEEEKARWTVFITFYSIWFYQHRTCTL